MNPPFSAMANVEGRVADAAFRHIASALNRLAPGGRLVTITGANLLSRDAGLARGLRRLAGTRRNGLHRRDRWRGLFPARHEFRDAAHGL